jgi:hypothetical protein
MMLWGAKTKWVISFDTIVELLHNQPTPPTTASLKLKWLQLIPRYQYPVDIEVNADVMRQITSINDQLMCLDDCLINGIYNSNYLRTMSIDDIHTCMTINDVRYKPKTNNINYLYTNDQYHCAPIIWLHQHAHLYQYRCRRSNRRSDLTRHLLLNR